MDQEPTTSAVRRVAVRQIMSRDVVACGPLDTLEYAAQLMWDHDCGMLPVVDRDDRVVGVVTDRDACMAAYTTGKPLGQLRVDHAMARRVHAIRESDLVGLAENVMNEFQVRRLPVVDERQHVTGVISLMDLARHVHRSQLHLQDGLSGDTVARTLAGIGRFYSPSTRG